MNAWFVRVAIAIDAVAQCVFPYGIPGETISARAGKAKRRGKRWGCLLCAALDLFNYGHCEGAVQGDIRRAQAVIDDLSHD
jgi:hypothetical protein